MSILPISSWKPFYLIQFEFSMFYKIWEIISWGEHSEWKEEQYWEMCVGWSWLGSLKSIFKFLI